MIQGINLATQSMTVHMQKQDQIANNLANINTTGYKQSNLFMRAYQKYLANDEHQPRVNREVKPDGVYVDYSEGVTKRTGNKLDVMIKGSGFFTVMSPDGVRYTRNGNFSMDPDGFLIASNGDRVMSTEGFVRVDRIRPITITETGQVVQEGQIKAVLRIADFQKPYKLLRDGDTCFRPQLPDNPPVESAGYVLMQGYLEGSNVNIIRNMTQMIATHRNFEADQRALLAQDQTLQKAVNDVGRLQ